MNTDFPEDCYRYVSMFILDLWAIFIPIKHINLNRLYKDAETRGTMVSIIKANVSLLKVQHRTMPEYHILFALEYK